MEVGIEEIQKVTGGIYSAEHRCAENPFSGEFRILYCESNEGLPQEKWELHMFRFAQPQDIEVGEASQANEIMCQSMFMLSFCPFCGEKLLHGCV